MGQMIVSGIALGAIYGLVALGIVLVFKATGVLNFAHGEAVMISTFVAFTLIKLGLPYWSLSQYLKHQVKNAVSFISDFETVLAHEARRRGFDGVVCGHIHKAEIRDMDGITYCNDGDWVESCTALVEHADGRLEVLSWAEVRQLSFA